MVSFEHLTERLAEEEAALTPEERAERERQHQEMLRSIAKRHEDMFAPFRSQEQVLSSLATAQRFQDLVDGPAARALRELAVRPALDSIHSTAEQMRRAIDTPSIRALTESTGAIQALAREQDALRRATESLHPPKLFEDMQRMVARTAALERPLPMPMPDLRPRVMRVRDEDQDERFAVLTETVSEQTAVIVQQQEELVRLRGEVRGVRDSAAKDARRQRDESRRRDEETRRLQWWVVIVGTVVATIVATWLMRVLGVA